MQAQKRKGTKSQRHIGTKQRKTYHAGRLCAFVPLSLWPYSSLFGFEEIFEMNDLVLFPCGIPGTLDF